MTVGPDDQSSGAAPYPGPRPFRPDQSPLFKGRDLPDVAAVVIPRLFAKAHTASVPVAMTGGVFRHSPLVPQVFYNELHALDPRVEVNPQVVEPVEGALRMARRGT